MRVSRSSPCTPPCPPPCTPPPRPTQPATDIATTGWTPRLELQIETKTSMARGVCQAELRSARDVVQIKPKSRKHGPNQAQVKKSTLGTLGARLVGQPEVPIWLQHRPKRPISAKQRKIEITTRCSTRIAVLAEEQGETEKMMSKSLHPNIRPWQCEHAVGLMKLCGRKACRGGG